MNDKRHRAKSDSGEENYWKQGELLRMTRLHGFLSDRGTPGVRSVRGVPPITDVRSRRQVWNCECVYHYFVTVNKKISCCNSEETTVRRASSPLQIPVAYNPWRWTSVYGHLLHRYRAERIRQVSDYAQLAHSAGILRSSLTGPLWGLNSCPQHWPLWAVSLWC
jgi:hypothetical protein